MTKVFPFDYDQHDLPNGLRLITVPTGFPHIVSLYIVVNVGSRNEVEEGKSGFAHLFEHMMFRGTEKYSPERYDAVLKQAGAAQNAYTDDDLTAYHTTFTRGDLEEILEMEADRFQNLEYSEDVFRTESRAVLAEYNKDSAEPFHLLQEKLRELAFEKHPYQHTTMGFLRDIEKMPELFEFSRYFHKTFYRPENTTILLAGDLTVEDGRALVEKHWGSWQRGAGIPAVPAAPPLAGPKELRVDWPSETMPLLQIAYRTPAYTDSGRVSAALDILSYLYFSSTSALYEALVLKEQSCDVFFGSNSDHVDPYLYLITARLKDPTKLEDVKQRVAATIAAMQSELVEEKRLEVVKKHLRYAFAMRMDETEGIAGLLARYVALRRSPETINALYEQYAQVSAEDLRQVAREYFVEANRVTVELRHSA
ncbi:M16 family metallopeptidase [Bryobacter aggregatus]|uniref:M16 family metallopeptidase n=1 Tax=Bryobacter aggregatus TaxID=360054 RepID=UPI000689CE36|nr:pitrilysin family protein [Bryobacter aggregatus]